MPRAAAAGDAVQFDLRQSELGARQLAVIAGRLLGRPGIGGARFLGAAGGFGGAALPVAGARQRGRVDAADADAGEMLRGRRGVVEEAQRDPAGGEFLLGLVDVARGQRGVARDQIGGAVFADVEHLRDSSRRSIHHSSRLCSRPGSFGALSISWAASANFSSRRSSWILLKM